VLSAVSLPPGITDVQLEPVSGSGQELVISFDQTDVDAITSEFSVPFDTLINVYDGNTDFQLTGPNGPVFGFSDPPAVENVVQNATSTDVIIPLRDPLSAGSYQVSLNWGSNLDFVFSQLGSSATSEFWTSIASASTPVTIDQFTVSPPIGPTLDQANNLGLIGSTVENVTGTLDFANVLSAVDLYQFTLATGHLWEVGLDVAAESIGSPLQPALSLFDDTGSILATSNSGTGLPNDPVDPYLFAGLEPGTYYVGISGAGNLAGSPGGYNPVTGVPGSAGQVQPGGLLPFELHLVALPHDQPTQLIGFNAGYEDPLNPSPTSLTLSFSGPIDAAGLFVPDQQETALDVIDSSGHIWPVTAEGYQSNDAQLTLVFDEPLPAGRYSLIVPASGGLTDLAGEPVVATGQPAGVLANWTVTSATGPKIPGDLGVLWPSTVNVVWPSANGAFSETTSLAPGQEATYRWVVIVPGTYKLQTQVVGSSIAVVNSSGASATVLDTDSTNGLNDYSMTLPAGVYELKFTNVGSHQADIRWLLKIEILDWEKVFYNGVSQSSALSLMMFAPPVASAGPEAETGLLSIPPSAIGDAFGGAIGPVPSNLLVTSNTALAGQPSWNTQAFAGFTLPVETEQGSLPGQAMNENFRPSLAPGDEPDNGDPALIVDAMHDRTPNAGPALSTAGTIQTYHDAESTSSIADIRALAESEWVTKIGTLVQHWFTTSREGTRNQLAGNEWPSPPAAVATGPGLFVKDPANSWRNRHFSSAARGEMSATASLIMVGAVAYRLRDPVRKWWRENRPLAVRSKCPQPRALSGPHLVAKMSRLKTHVRRS
jgi:hypothetical protein